MASTRVHLIWAAVTVLVVGILFSFAAYYNAKHPAPACGGDQVIAPDNTGRHTACVDITNVDDYFN